jgi:D-threonate/D-erythronate kinase
MWRSVVVTEQAVETTPGITVLADDLSGAAEVAGVFLGRNASVSLQLNNFRPSAGVTVVDLNTRSMSPQQAADTIRAAVADIPADFRVVKKIDSLLRGHIGREVAVLADRGPVVVAAALPALSRTVRGGVLYLGQTPLHESHAWAAERALPPRRIAELFGDLPIDPKRLEICDAATDADLDAIVGRAAGAQLVGTSAMAAAVARTLPPGRPGTGERRSSKTVLAVVGTAASVAADQVDALVARGAHPVTVDVQALLHDKADPEPVQEALSSGSAVVTVGGVVERAEGRAVSTALGRFIAVAEGEYRPDLVLTGGETARAVVDAIGVRTLHPLHEIHHGAVESIANDGRRIVTRPGSFGTANSLVAIVKYLTQRSEDNT